MAIDGSRITAVVIGGVHHNTLGVVRSLGQAGVGKRRIKLMLVGGAPDARDVVSTTRYVANGNVVHLSSDREIVDSLIEAADSASRPVIICCSDGSAEAVMASREKLDDFYYLPSLDVDASAAMSKEFQAAVAEEAGLNIPETGYFTVGDEVKWSYFPCIMKPLKSTIGGGKADIKVSSNREELEKNLGAVRADSFLLQRFVERDIEYQLIGLSLDGGEKIIIPGYTVILRQPENTNTGYLKYSPVTEFHYDFESVQGFIKRLGYSGLFSIEFIRDRAGKDWFLEINMRNDGNGYCVKSAGVNLPYIWYRYRREGVLPDCPLHFDKAIYFMPELNDFKRGVRAVGVAGWVGQFAGAKSHAVYNLKDPMPFFVVMAEKVKRRLKRLLSSSAY